MILSGYQPKLTLRRPQWPCPPLFDAFHIKMHFTDETMTYL